MPWGKYLLYLVSSSTYIPPNPFIIPISPQSDDFFPHPIAPFHPHSKPTRSPNLASISESHSLFLPFHSPFHTHYLLHPFPTFFSISSNPTKSNPFSPLSPSLSSSHRSLHTPPQSPPIQSIHHSQSELTLSTPTPPTTQSTLPTPNQRTSSMVSTFTPFCQLTIAYR